MAGGHEKEGEKVGVKMKAPMLVIWRQKRGPKDAGTRQDRGQHSGDSAAFDIACSME